MSKEDIYREFQERVTARRDSLDPEDSPMSKSETEAYMEGWRSAFGLALDILGDIVSRKEGSVKQVDINKE